ncbi:DUF3566 domain-containing protein [Gordonia sp. CPCC 205515]|uniref:DUF3566 domain-containing protein n=1 Tax=Gordonia sp. CPCC 205515 TaxID=3140791 RepID=UPI003AF33B7E
MSSPNTPENKKPTNGDVGPGSGPGMPGPGKGGLVPPWQRGQTDTGPGSGVPNGTARAAGPPPRGIVSATAEASMTGQQAPVTKLDDPRSAVAGARKGGTATVAELAEEKFVESPTRHIDRDDLPAEKLPNLDAIHHVEDTPTKASKTPRSAPAEVGVTRALRAAVQIRRIDPWATFKIAAVLSVVGFLIWMISIAVLYLILDGMGVWDQVNSSFGTLVTADGSSSEGDIIGAGTVFGYAALLGAINAILLTALATIGAYIYNLCADLIGGAEVTLADLD